MTGSRLVSGGRIDRKNLLHVTFDGQPLRAHPGDTLASALLATGIMVAGRSVVLGRPRGVTSDGPEESTAVIQVETPFPEPMLTATTVEAVNGLAASSLFGQGRLASDSDPAIYDAIHHHCEVAVVGAGPAGLAAALTAARSGARVLLVDERPTAGGNLLTDSEIAWAAGLTEQLARHRNVRHLQRTTVTGYYDDNFLIAVQRRTDHPDPGLPQPAARQRVWRIRAAEVVLATGAHERPIVFAGNDRPGVMLAESVRAYLHRYGVLAGERVVIFTTNDDAYRVAGDLLAVGAHVVIVDPRTPAGQPTDAPDGALPTGTVLAGAVVVGTESDAVGLTGVQVRCADGSVVALPADLLAVSGGWNPAVHLYSQAGGKLSFDPDMGSFRPAGTHQRLTVAGAANGLRTTAEIVDDGERAGLAVSEAVSASASAQRHEYVSADVPPLNPPDDGLETYPEPSAQLYLVTAGDGVDPRTLTTHFVDVQRDVSVADLVRATGAGLAGMEHVKRYTTAGTAHDQGKTSGVLATAVVAHLIGVPPGELGTTTYRPPYTPVGFAALAGRERGDLYDPIRITGAHAWHVAHGAEFENVGQWKRPWYYPQPPGSGEIEDLETAVARESRAARTNVAFMDGSTLGKIDVQGRDAGEFLDMLYTNLMSNLKVGAIRYGVMCGVDGMVLDDGTVFRLAPTRFLVTTTTGNAAKILDWMEEWLQTEWSQLQVWCTSVTEQWATMALIGPNSRSLLGSLAPELAVSNDDFPFMTWRDTDVAGLAARVARISFSGELAYEINVAWWDASALWDAVWAAGSGVGLVPYGTETMHVLRAEKGFPIIGQDSDGTVTPQDLGMSWAVSKKKLDYLGKRSHARAENHRRDRKHLVGLLPRDEKLLMAEGSQLVDVIDASAPLVPPVPMLGHVTSSYRSVALGRTFALAMLAGGRDRIGETVHVVVDDVPAPVVVTSAVLVDPDNLRRDGDPDGRHGSGSRPDPDGRHDPGSRNGGSGARTIGTRHLPVSPLASFADQFMALSRPQTAGIRIAESALLTAVNVRVTPGSAAAQSVSEALGTDLPIATGQVRYAGADALLALGPDEFLIISGPGHGTDLESRIRAALNDQPGAVTDVSAARTMLRLSGRNVRKVLAHGVGIDLDRLPESSCAQTLLAQCAVVLFSDGPPGTDDDLIKVLVRSSFAVHLARWLLLTAPEYV